MPSAFQYNHQYWLATREQLQNDFLKRKAIAEMKPPKKNTKVHDIFTTMYIYTNSIVRRLSYLYHVTFQVQKRELIRRLLLASTKRLLELRNELKQLELSEYIYMDKQLINLRVALDEIQLLKPFYFPFTRDPHIQDLIDGKVPNIETVQQSAIEELKASASRRALRHPHHPVESTPSIDPAKKERITACTIIKSHEKARKARLWMNNIRLDPDKYRPQAPALQMWFHYDYTHRPEQPMLVPVKRTFYQRNYLLERKESDAFDFYENPVRRRVRLREEKVKRRSRAVLVELPISAEFDEIIDEECGAEESASASQSVDMKAHAARVIQAAWRRYKLNKRIKKRLHEKHVLYGMVTDWTWKSPQAKYDEADRIKKRNKKALFDRQFISAVENEKSRIIKVRGPWIMEDISEHIRAWFREFYDGTGEFDRYPEEFEGGTILVIRGETPTAHEFHKAREERMKRAKMTPEDKKKEQEKLKAQREKRKEKEQRAKQMAKLQKLREAKLGKTYEFKTMTEHEMEMERIMEEYRKEWEDINEEANIYEDPYMHWISADKFAEVHQELRLVVDKMMRLEFERLRQSLAEDRKKKYKPQKARKPKRAKGKAGKKGKKGTKDLTVDRTIDSLFHEIKSLGLIKKIEPKSLDDYVGEYNFTAFEKRTVYQLDPPPGKGEIKDVIREAIIGMGPLDLPKSKSILLAGPPKSGKQFLAEAIATEMDALVLDISPENVTQFENDMKYFLHLINKMSRALQPTILYIRGCERVFWKTVPKKCAEIKPRLLGKYIIKQIIKQIKPEDKILVLGLSDEPFKGKLPKMRQCFEKTIIVPRADYGTAFQLNRTGALSKLGVPRDIEFTPLAMVTKGYASSTIYNNIERTLNIDRRMKFPVKPLRVEELIEGYLVGQRPRYPIPDKDFSKYTKFYTKVNKLAKQRAKYMKELEELKAKKEKQNKAKGKK